MEGLFMQKDIEINVLEVQCRGRKEGFFFL